MLKHFNLDIFEKDSNKLSEQNYMDLKFKNRDDEFIVEQSKRIKYNFELNMKYFDSLNYDEFNNYLEKFMIDNQFTEIKNLKEYIGVSGIYVMVLDEYKQVYIGITDNGIKERIKQHWNAKKEPERLIFGQAFNSVLSIDSFGALDTTRIFVKTDGNLYAIENKFVDDFDKRFLLNRTMGGIGSSYTYTDDEKTALVAIAGNAKRRDFSPFIDEKELYEQCNSYDTDMYEYKKKKGLLEY
ncbi:MAG: GIY-YIG nuclease family protein [Clostridiales bacterium]|nr:GIY-YIG nuclease family protein [Clostridiales bacterium]